jgi:hypothetical protein
MRTSSVRVLVLDDTVLESADPWGGKSTSIQLYDPNDAVKLNGISIGFIDVETLDRFRAELDWLSRDWHTRQHRETEIIEAGDGPLYVEDVA